MVLIILRSRIQSLYGSFTEELDSKILVGQLRIFWHSVAGAKEGKKRSKKRLQTGQVASIILYILHGPCVFLNTSYFRTEGRKRTRTGNTPKGKGSPACHNTLNAYTPWISHQSTLQLIHWQTNLSLGIITDLPQTLFSSIQAEKGLKYINSSFLAEELRTWPCRSASVRIPSKCSDSRLGLQQAGVRMRNQWLFPLEKCKRVGEDPMQPTDLELSYWHSQERLAGEKGGNDRKMNV